MRPKRHEKYQRCQSQAKRWPYKVERFNKNMHWRVQISDRVFDFWPHTGRFREPTKSGGYSDTADDFNDFIARVLKHAAQDQVSA